MESTAEKAGNVNSAGSEERGKIEVGQVAKVGNLASDLELAYSPGGKPYARGRFAVSRPLEPGNWAGGRATDFYDLTIFGSLAEHAANSLHRGDRVVLVGRGEIERWMGRDGSARESKRILAAALGPDLRWAEATVTKAAAGEPASVGVDASGVEISF